MPLLRKAVVGPERRNPCTHMTMTRLYDAYGSFKCAICNKHPAIGWLYRCTQDTAGFLPESDFTNESPVATARPGQDVTAHSLSPSVIKAIGQGLYTDDQVKKLIQLKQGVRNHVMSQHPEASRPATSSTFSTTSSSSSDGNCTFSTIPQSTTFSTTSSTSSDEEIKQAYDWKELQKVWMSEPAMTPPEPRLQLSTPYLHPVTLLSQRATTVSTPEPCNFMTCHTCRPTYRERAYPSLDDIVSNPTNMPPLWELQNQRVSDARVVAQIGLPKLDRSRFYAQSGNVALPSSRTLPGIVIDDTDGEVDICDESSGQYEPYVVPGRVYVPGDPNYVDPCADRTSDTKAASSPNKRSSFRESLRKVIARAWGEDSASTDSSTSTSESGAEAHNRPQARSRASSSLLFHRHRSRSSTLSFSESPGARIVDTTSLQDSVVLMVATNTPLPLTPSSNRFNLSGVPDGGVGHERMNNENSCLSPADIITQARAEEQD